MPQVYNLFGEAMSTSESFGWLLRMLWLMWLSEEGKKILGVWRWRRGYCSVVMDGSVVWAALVRCSTARLKQDKTDNVNLKWDSNSITNRRCKMHQQKVLDVKYISRAMAFTVISEHNCRNCILLSKLNFTVETELSCRNWILVSKLNTLVAEKQCTSSFGRSSTGGREAVI